MVSAHTALINGHTSSPVSSKAIQLPTFRRRSTKTNPITTTTGDVIPSFEEKAISRSSTESSVTITSSPPSVRITEIKERKPVAIGVIPQVNNKYGRYDSDSFVPSSSHVVGVIPQVHGRDLPNPVHNNVIGVVPSGFGPLPKIASSFASGAVQKKEKVNGEKKIKENKVVKKDAAVVGVIPLMKNGKYDEPPVWRKDVIGVVPFGETQRRCDVVGVIPNDFAPLSIIPRAF